MASTPSVTIDAIRSLLSNARLDCDDPGCAGWAVFESSRGLEIERCDTCCPEELDDEDIARLPEAQAALRAAKAFADAPKCPHDGAVLRTCRLRDPACMHCDVCDWCGDPSRTAKAPTTSTRRALDPDPVERAIADAERHGDESNDADHEVGDLQDLVRLLARQMTPAQVATAMRDWAPWCDFESEDGEEDEVAAPC